LLQVSKANRIFKIVHQITCKEVIATDNPKHKTKILHEFGITGLSAENRETESLLKNCNPFPLLFVLKSQMFIVKI